MSIASTTRKLLVAGLFTGISLVIARTWGDLLKTLSSTLILESRCAIETGGAIGNEEARFACERRHRRESGLLIAAVNTLATTLLMGLFIWLLVVATGGKMSVVVKK